MSKKSFIDSVEVKSPCSEEWERMKGNDRVRFCDHCSKDVKNLSAITRKEAMRLVRASGGDLCIRYIANPVTRRPMFAEQLVQIARRTPGLAAGVMSASISFSTFAYGQTPTEPAAPEPVVAERQIDSPEPETVRNDDKETEKTGGVIRGTIRDEQGKPVPGVSVYLACESRYNGNETDTDEDGNYEFDKLEPETYMLRVVTVSGDVRKVAPGLTLSADETIVQDLNVRTHIHHVPAGGDGVGYGSSNGWGSGGAYAAIEYSLPLSRAVANDDIEEVRRLLDAGEKAGGRDDNYEGITPLFIAVENGNVAITRLLIQYGANVNARDKQKRTPLMFIDDDATPDLIEVLLRAGAKVNVHDKTGTTPLLVAAGSAGVMVVQALIDGGADLDAADEEGMTSLMKAVENEDAAIVDALIAAGADLELKDKKGNTAWDKTSDPVIEKALVEAGARVSYDVEVEVVVEDEEKTPTPVDPPAPPVARPRH